MGVAALQGYIIRDIIGLCNLTTNRYKDLLAKTRVFAHHDPHPINTVDFTCRMYYYIYALCAPIAQLDRASGYGPEG